MEDIFAWKVLEEATRIRSALKFPWKGPTNPRGGKVGASGNPGNNRHEWTFVKTTSAVETSLCGPDMKRQMWTKEPIWKMNVLVFKHFASVYPGLYIPRSSSHFSNLSDLEQCYLYTLINHFHFESLCQFLCIYPNKGHKGYEGHDDISA